ncbi:hypothetical protein P4E94_14365, partial [Pontiellaceae bacterium B12219]|nr:hypothetical protein [Pontiellaceae bacterium B12219]
MKKCRWLLVFTGLLTMGLQAQEIILSNDFETGISTNVTKYSGRFKDEDLDDGWFANLPNMASEWEVSGGQLENSATNTGGYPAYLPAEGGVVQMVSYTADTNNVVDLSVDYNVAAGDTLYVHLWGLDGTIVEDGGNLANFQAGAGALYDNTDTAADAVVAYALNNGFSKPTLVANSGQAVAGLTGSGTYTNSFNVAELQIEGIETAGDFEYYLIAFCKAEDGLPGTTSVDNVLLTTSYIEPPPPAESGIIENPVFPDQDVIASQLANNNDAGINYTINSSTAIGQSFSFASAQSLGAFSVQKSGDLNVPFDGTNVLTLWIGEYDSTTAPASHTVGATLYTNSFNISGNSFADGFYYTFNLSSNITLEAGREYAFELTWTSADETHSFGIKRYYDNPTGSGIDQYPDGTIIYQTGVAGVLPAVSLINEPDNDLVFALHSSEVDVYPFVTVEPSEILMFFDSASGSLVTGSVDMVYNSATNMDITITVSDETQPGSFSVLTATPQTLITPYPDATPIEIAFDNSVASLAPGSSATGLVTIAWSESGGGESGSVVVPVSATAAFAADANNTFVPGVGVWGDPANWSLGRVPGMLGADRGIVQNAGLVCNVETNFTGLFPYRVWVRTASGTPSVVNIGADMKGMADISVGQASSQYGIVNQTAGTVTPAALNIGDPAETAPSNSYYNLTGGTLELGTKAPTIYSTGVLNIDGGAVTIDQGPANLVVSGAGVVKLQSGSFNSVGTAANDVLTFNTSLEVSGGSLTLLGQNKFAGGLTVIGDEASISIHRFGTPNTMGEVVFVMGETGVSTIVGPSWATLSSYNLTVDGADYVGGSTTIDLVSAGNLTAGFASVTFTNFAEGITTSVTQDEGDNNKVILTITVPGYAGWIGGYGLSGTDADWNVDYDGDTENNFYEYAFG